MKSENRICQNCKQEFAIEPDDFGFYEKMDMPLPEICPLCRQKLRTAFRNFKTLYKRPCSKSGKIIVSAYHSETKFPVYDIPEWWSDDWDVMAYGVDIDFKKSFFEQLGELFNKVPHLSLWSVISENCQYSNQIDNSKNCYLIFGGLNDEDCDYGHIVWNCRDSIDNLYLFKSESCYECIDCLNCNKLFYSEECDGCAESIGLFDCRGLLNCIGCVGLVNKSYCIFNEQKTKAEYEKFIKENPLSKLETIKNILAKKEELKRSLPQRSFFGFRNSDVSGNHIYNAHNIHYSFDIKSGENSKFCFTVREAIDSYDLSFTGNASECYQCLTMLGSNKIIGSQTIVDSHDVFYSEACFNCDNIFGCYGLRKKSYCIFNKQYSKEEYFVLKEKLLEKMKIDGEWGKFLPYSLSPFAYNEAIVNEYMPLTKEKALKEGFRWKDDIPSTSGQETIKLSDLPTTPKDYSDELVNEILECEKCNKNYRLINREIGFYKKMGLPLPKQCFNCRHERRMKARNPRSLWDMKCAKCGKEIKTSYTPENQKI
ncbi:hypothetical protein COX93_02185, partial [Candidatus Nomurabacteria bacterium CG_4_10_14_0_2_um_filter_30_12]